MEPLTPAYMEMDPYELQTRVEQLEHLASPCTLCPRECGSARKEEE